MFLIIKSPSRSEARIAAIIVSRQIETTVTAKEILNRKFEVAIDENGKVWGAVSNKKKCYAASKDTRNVIRGIIKNN